MDLGIYRLLLKPVLFKITPEKAQNITNFMHRQSLIWRTLPPIFRICDKRLEVDLCEFKIKNAIGLAAGYDKNCEYLTSMTTLGFGYITVGTIREHPNPGNPKPRMLRYTKDYSLINSFGFNGKGLEFAAHQLEQFQESSRRSPIVASVSGTTVNEILRCHRRMESLVNAVEINISSPNTSGLQVFQNPAEMSRLLDQINNGRQKPLFVKLPPYKSSDGSSSGDNNRDNVMELVRICLQHNVEALTVANTWPSKDSRLAVGRGGISGKLVYPHMIKMVTEIKTEIGNKAIINASGGIFTGTDAWEALQAGASTVQILTGLIYRGPSIVKQIKQELLEIMDSEGLPSLSA